MILKVVLSQRPRLFIAKKEKVMNSAINYFNQTDLTKIESAHENKTWTNGPYNFLLQRTSANYDRSKVANRRNAIAAQLSLHLPEIDDLLLEKLYESVVSEYYKSLPNHKNGFKLNSYEVSFIKSFETLQKNLAKLKDVSLIPTLSNKRICIGPYIPDFLILGLSTKGYSLLAIEINGGSHINKLDKDFSKENRLHELGIYSLPIQNPDVANLSFLEKIFNDSKIINISNRPDQIKNVLRRIWAKTIVNFWSLKKIEAELKNLTQSDFYLTKEFQLINKLKDCPRILKMEYLEWKKSN